MGRPRGTIKQVIACFRLFHAVISLILNLNKSLSRLPNWEDDDLYFILYNSQKLPRGMVEVLLHAPLVDRRHQNKKKPISYDQLFNILAELKGIEPLTQFCQDNPWSLYSLLAFPFICLFEPLAQH